MHATHSTKLLTPKAKQQAVCSDILNPLPAKYITSQSTQLTKKYWVCPSNGANYKKFEKFDGLPDILPPQILPKITCGRTKQILVPNNSYWEDDNYLTLSPLPSMGLLHEVWLRAKQYNAYRSLHIIQANPMAYTNHGEMMVTQSGKLAYLKRGKKVNIGRKGDKATAIQVVFDATNVNITGNHICIGHPSLTAIGGMVHNIERITGIDNISFACGMLTQASYKTMRGSSFKRNPKKVFWNVPAEMTGCARYVLLLSCDDIDLLHQKLNENPQCFNRFCGGNTSYVHITKLVEQEPISANYLNKVNVGDLDTKGDKDLLDFIIKSFVKGGEKESTLYSLNSCGYAFLEEPKKRENSRNDYLHAWAENMNRIVGQGNFDQYLSWWDRYKGDGYIAWD